MMACGYVAIDDYTRTDYGAPIALVLKEIIPLVEQAVDEARAAIWEATPVLGAETVGTREAHGRVLAEEVRSGRTLPPADSSAMDGYWSLTRSVGYWT